MLSSDDENEFIPLPSYLIEDSPQKANLFKQLRDPNDGDDEVTGLLKAFTNRQKIDKTTYTVTDQLGPVLWFSRDMSRADFTRLCDDLLVEFRDYHYRPELDHANPGGIVFAQSDFVTKYILFNNLDLSATEPDNADWRQDTRVLVPAQKKSQLKVHTTLRCQYSKCLKIPDASLIAPPFTQVELNRICVVFERFGIEVAKKCQLKRKVKQAAVDAWLRSVQLMRGGSPQN
eukprot:c10274_g1_i1.p1 GENE.c10274_g1_i1~~c10274_g1_i1.p1  ORF type:complete len:241 (+),score=62.94 c10274_g1_i1:32-724(+)